MLVPDREKISGVGSTTFEREWDGSENTTAREKSDAEGGIENLSGLKG